MCVWIFLESCLEVRNMVYDLYSQKKSIIFRLNKLLANGDN